MNEESTASYGQIARVDGYADGTYNLVLRDGYSREKVDIDRETAERICEHFDEPLPDPDPEPPTRMG